jgi:hypothetical protein
MMIRNLFFQMVTSFLVILATAGPVLAGGQLREVPIDAKALAAGRQCEPAPNDWRATWIASSDALGEMMKRCRSHLVGAPSENLPAVDFDRFGVLAVEMGRCPSAGYGFKTDEMTAKKTGKTVTITLPHVQPPPGAMTAQVMTSPWVLIQLPLENFSEIRVVDPAGALLVQTGRP